MQLQRAGTHYRVVSIMKHPNTTQGTQQPTVSPSEPEQQHRIIQELSDVLKEDTTRHILYPEVIHAYLKEQGMDTDKKGFIIRTDSGDYVEPYEFNVEAYKETNNTSNTDLTQYFTSKTDKEWVDDDLRIHMTNVHGFVHITGTAYPVFASSLNIKRFRDNTGSFFPVSTAWSSIHETESVDYDILTDVHVKKIESDKNHREELYCYNCEFTGTIDEWLNGDEVETGEVQAEKELKKHFEEVERNTETNESKNINDAENNNESLDELDEVFENSHVDFTSPVCPECHAKWDSDGVFKCKSCGNEEWRAGVEYFPDMCDECGEIDSITLINRN